jgi:hypothetical protein
MDGWMDKWMNDTVALVEMTLTGKPKYSEENLFQCSFVNHKSHMDWPGLEPRISTVKSHKVIACPIAQLLSYCYCLYVPLHSCCPTATACMYHCTVAVLLLLLLLLPVCTIAQLLSYCYCYCLYVPLHSCCPTATATACMYHCSFCPTATATPCMYHSFSPT